jgi:hypothetical protein
MTTATPRWIGEAEVYRERARGTRGGLIALQAQYVTTESGPKRSTRVRSHSVCCLSTGFWSSGGGVGD